MSDAPTLDRDHPCRGCGYNLRGLPCDGRCPECGQDVARSLAAVPLESESVDWLYAMLCALLAAAATPWLLLIGGAGALIAERLPWRLGNYFGCFAAAAPLPALVAAWVLARPGSDERTGEARWAARRWLRWIVVAQLWTLVSVSAGLDLGLPLFMSGVVIGLFFAMLAAIAARMEPLQRRAPLRFRGYARSARVVLLVCAASLGALAAAEPLGPHSPMVIVPFVAALLGAVFGLVLWTIAVARTINGVAWALRIARKREGR